MALGGWEALAPGFTQRQSISLRLPGPHLRVFLKCYLPFHGLYALFSRDIYLAPLICPQESIIHTLHLFLLVGRGATVKKLGGKCSQFL